MPETTSYDTARQLAEQIESTTGKPAWIITHNVKFVTARKLDEREAAELLGTSGTA